MNCMQMRLSLKHGDNLYVYTHSDEGEPTIALEQPADSDTDRCGPDPSEVSPRRTPP